MAARGISKIHSRVIDSDQRQASKHMTSPNSWKADAQSAVVHVMLANFSDEEIILPKATILGVAEGISESLVASINEGPEFENHQRCQEQSTSKQANQSGKFNKYLHEKLQH